jgi:ankyrin repeat protein
MVLTDAEIKELQERYADVVNYEGDDPLAPIHPLTYVAPDGDNLLHIAAYRGDLRAVQLLVKGGLDVNQRGDMGCTPLHYARMRAKHDVSAFLLDHGASESIENEFGKLPGQ